MMIKEDQRAFDDLLQRTNKHFSISYLASRRSTFGLLLLTMVIEVQKETEKLKDEIEWKLKKQPP